MTKVAVVGTGGAATAAALEKALTPLRENQLVLGDEITHIRVDAAHFSGLFVGKEITLNGRNFKITKIDPAKDEEGAFDLAVDLVENNPKINPLNDKSPHMCWLRTGGLLQRSIPKNATDKDLREVLFDNALFTISKRYPLKSRADRRRMADAEAKESFKRIRAEEKRLREEDRRNGTSSSAS